MTNLDQTKKVSFRANCLFLGQIVIFRATFFRPPSTTPSRTPMMISLTHSCLHNFYTEAKN